MAVQKLVDVRPFYLIRGTVRSPKANPRGVTGWVEYARARDRRHDRVPVGHIGSTERYDQIAEAWVLVYQYTTTTKFGASVEAEYDSFEFAQR